MKRLIACASAAVLVALLTHGLLVRDSEEARAVHQSHTREIANPQVNTAADSPVDSESARDQRLEEHALGTQGLNVGSVQRDQRTIALGLLDSATNGDPESQYRLWKIIRYCKTDADRLKNKTVYDSIGQLPSPNPRAIAAVIERYERCGEFYTHGFQEFSGYQRFRDDAADSGHPEAMIDVALGLAISGSKDSQRVRDLVVRALESGHPEVLMRVGVLTLIPGLLDEPTAMAFALTACELGFDCSSSGDRIKTLCLGAGCPDGETIQSYFRRIYGTGDFTYASERVPEVRSQIENKKIDETNFNWSVLSHARSPLTWPQNSASQQDEFGRSQ